MLTPFEHFRISPKLGLLTVIIKLLVAKHCCVQVNSDLMVLVLQSFAFRHCLHMYVIHMFACLHTCVHDHSEMISFVFNIHFL